MIGLARDGAYDAALVALPAKRLPRSIRGQGARVALRGAARRLRALGATGKRVCVSHEVPEAARECLLQRGFEV